MFDRHNQLTEDIDGDRQKDEIVISYTSNEYTELDPELPLNLQVEINGEVYEIDTSMLPEEYIITTHTTSFLYDVDQDRTPEIFFTFDQGGTRATGIVFVFQYINGTLTQLPDPVTTLDLKLICTGEKYILYRNGIEWDGSKYDNKDFYTYNPDDYTQCLDRLFLEEDQLYAHFIFYDEKNCHDVADFACILTYENSAWHVEKAM